MGIDRVIASLPTLDLPPPLERREQDAPGHARGAIRSGMPKRLPPVTADALKRWMQVRGTEDGPLFVRIDRRGTLRPDRLSRDGIHDMSTKLGAVSGIKRRVRPHGIRHAAITKASRRMKTANLWLPALQAFSNHRSPATLGRYIDPDNEAAYSLATLVFEADSLG